MLGGVYNIPVRLNLVPWERGWVRLKNVMSADRTFDFY
jgi:hypothetical protein